MRAEESLGDSPQSRVKIDGRAQLINLKTGGSQSSLASVSLEKPLRQSHTSSMHKESVGMSSAKKSETEADSPERASRNSEQRKIDS